MNSLISCPNCGFLQKMFKTMQDNEFIICIKCNYKWIVLDQNSLKKSNIKFVLNDPINNTTTTIDNSSFIKKAKPEAVIRQSVRTQSDTIKKPNNSYVQSNSYSASSHLSEEANAYKNKPLQGSGVKNYTPQNQAQSSSQYMGQKNTAQYSSKQSSYSPINNNINSYIKKEQLKNSNINVNQDNIDKYLNQNKNNAYGHQQDSLLNTKTHLNSEVKKLNENINISNNDLQKAQDILQKIRPCARCAFKPCRCPLRWKGIRAGLDRPPTAGDPAFRT